MDKRTKKLLLEISQQLEDGSAIFTTDWLVENKIGLSEAMALGSTLAALVYGFTKAPEWVRIAALSSWSAKGIMRGEDCWSVSIGQHARDQIR